MNALDDLMKKDGKDFVERCIGLISLSRSNTDVEIALAAAEQYVALREAVQAARRLMDNFAEFETITDGEFIDALAAALAKLDALEGK